MSKDRNPQPTHHTDAERMDQQGRRLKGRYGDDAKPILPTLCPLDRKDLGQLVQNEIFGVFNDEFRNEVLRDTFDVDGHAPSDFMRFCTVRKGGHLNLTMFVERLAKLEYDAQMLLCRKSAGLAHRILVA